MNLFLFRCILLVDFIRVDWIEAKTVFNGNSSAFVTMTDRISSTKDSSKHYK